MKNTLILATALTLLATLSGNAFATHFHGGNITGFNVDVEISDDGGNLVAILQSNPNDPENVIDLTDTTADVNYNGTVIQSSIALLPQGAPFNVHGGGTIQTQPGTFDTEIVSLSLNSSLGGDFNLQLIGTRDPLDFNLTPGPPQPVGNTGLFISSHRITPEPGSLVLLGLASAGVFGTRRRGV
ncbi:MAG: hypothetical protein CMJ18_13050 [Phycisphaeraceae bacterium]|nr:hypothetical protein [Phycisphaeraceae bacterium]